MSVARFGLIDEYTAGRKSCRTVRFKLSSAFKELNPKIAEDGNVNLEWFTTLSKLCIPNFTRYTEEATVREHI